MSIGKRVITMEVTICRCERCGYEWTCKNNPPPMVCSHCRSPYWD